MTTTTAPKMVRMGNGRMVPALPPIGMAKPKTKKFIVVIQYYQGDITAAEELCSLIADLERTRNHDADILLLRRSDSREITPLIIDKLKSKFDVVHSLKCRRGDAKGHPWACNSMFYDLVSLMSESSQFRDSYYAFVNMETDAVPTRPGWIEELILEWKGAMTRGKSIIGEMRTDPRQHLNGLAVYAADIGNRVRPYRLSGGNPKIAYDIAHSPVLLPHCEDTPLIFVQWRLATVAAEQVFVPRRELVEPAIFHGVKDGSARAAVRERHIAMGTTVRRPNVYTYMANTALWGNDDRQACLDLWREGWMTRGWNPVILSRRDAVKHPKFAQFEAALAKLPCATDRVLRDADLLRWLALDSAGGGLMVGWDVLPDAIAPADMPTDGRVALLGGAFISKSEISQWVDAIILYDAQPEDVENGKLHVTDETIMKVANFSAASLGLKQFNESTLGTKRKSAAMAEFLRGK